MLAMSLGFSRVLLAGSVAYVVALGAMYPLASVRALPWIGKGAD
jgi:hypothetical protein